MKNIAKMLTACVCAGFLISNVSAKTYSDLKNNHWASPQIQKLSKDDVESKLGK